MRSNALLAAVVATAAFSCDKPPPGGGAGTATDACLSNDGCGASGDTVSTDGNGCPGCGVCVCESSPTIKGTYTDDHMCIFPAETCDGLDNDCSGTADDNIPVSACSSACGQGQQSCQGG
jgi:hypothetical protein